MVRETAWPALAYDDWPDTCTTLHLWSQIVGKVRLAVSPWLNHSWHATLYPTARGFTTGTLADAERVFQVDLDLVEHRARIVPAVGRERELALEGQTVASFYRWTTEALDGLGLDLEIHRAPNELPEAIPFADDDRGAYDREAVRRFHGIVLQSERVFRRFRSRFLGKSSPPHLFWGSFDLAVTRFSGRRAPEHPAASPTCRTRSPGRPTPTRSRAPAGGRARAASATRPTTATPGPSPKASPRPP